MRKGFAIEGFIKGDGTVKPLEKYDDTEVKAGIAANKESIDDLKSRATADENRITALENGQVITGEGTPGNFVGFDNEGKLADSGKKPADFAAASHEHTYVMTKNAEVNGEMAKVVTRVAGGNGYVEIYADSPSTYFRNDHATITAENLGNLKRALETPVAPASGGDVLITNGQVYAALEGKADTAHNHAQIITNNTETTGEMAKVVTRAIGGMGYVEIYADSAATHAQNAHATITAENLGNLKRALEDPAAPAYNGTKLITNGQVYEALAAASLGASVKYVPNWVSDDEYSDESMNLDDDFAAGFAQLTYIITIGADTTVSITDLFFTAGTLTTFGATLSYATGDTLFVNAYKITGGFIIKVDSVYNDSESES